MDNNDDWNLVTGQGYILNRNRSHAAASRLNVQFYLWKSVLKYNIHPSISAALPEAPVIAEVAAGTCVWLMDVAREVPKAQLDGLDYNLRQAPPQEWLPPNTTKRHWNIFDDVPDDLVGKYDYVHTRLLVLVVENQDPRPVIHNLRKLLKPGGFLQWDEIDAVNVHIKKIDSKQDTPAMDQLKVWAWGDGRYGWTVELSQLLAQGGFENATADFIGDPPELARAFTEVNLLVVEEFAEGLAKLGKKDVANKYFKLIEEAYEESVAGAALCFPRVVYVARKPLAGHVARP